MNGGAIRCLPARVAATSGLGGQTVQRLLLEVSGPRGKTCFGISNPPGYGKKPCLSEMAGWEVWFSVV